MQQVYEKESDALGLNTANGPGLTDYQKSLLDRIRNINKEPMDIHANTTQRSPQQIAESIEIHKRVNPGYVDMPYTSSNTLDFKVRRPPPRDSSTRFDV